MLSEGCLWLPVVFALWSLSLSPCVVVVRAFCRSVRWEPSLGGTPSGCFLCVALWVVLILRIMLIWVFDVFIVWKIIMS